MDLPNQGSAFGFFGWTQDAEIKNVRLENINYLAGGNISNTVLVGGFASYAVNTHFYNVSVAGTISVNGQGWTDSDQSVQLGGIIGRSEDGTLVERTYSEVNILVALNPHGDVIAGGLVGFTNVSDTNLPLTRITNTYSTGNITVTGISDGNMFAGGIIGQTYFGEISKSYSTGTITLPADETTNRVSGGISAALIASNISDSFSAMHLTSNTGDSKKSGSIAGGLVNGDQMPVSSITNSYFDKSATTISECYYTYVGSNATPGECNAVNTDGSQPNYFLNNRVNPPLNSWDFSTPVWFTQTSSYPKFTGSTPVVPPVTPPSNPPQEPPVTPPTSNPTTKPRPTKPRPATVTPTATTTPIPEPKKISELFSVTPTPSLTKVKSKTIKQIPQALNVLPFAFLSLLLVLALFYAIAALKEYRYKKTSLQVLSQIKTTNALVTQYVDICMHYLTTPLAVLKASHELLTTKQALNSEFLLAFGSKLNVLEATIQSTLKENETPLQNAAHASEVSHLDDDTRYKQFWVKLLAIAVLVATIDLYLILSDAYSVPRGRLLNHFLLFSLGSVLCVSMYYFTKKMRSLHQEVKSLTTTQESLLHAKNQLLYSASSKLAEITSNLRVGTQGLEQIPDARTLLNGLTMLDKLTTKLNAPRTFTTIADDAPVIPLSSYYNQQIAPQFTDRLTKKNIKLIVSISPDSSLQVSSEEAEQLLSSVIDNAIEFTPQNGSISIDSVKKSNGTQITIKNSGTIAEDKIRSMFEPLTRGTSTETFNHEGLGLNMFINKLIIEKRGGTIKATSTNAETTVQITLPTPDDTSFGMAQTVIKPFTS